MRAKPPHRRVFMQQRPALGQEIFDIAKTHTESVMQPDGVADDL